MVTKKHAREEAAASTAYNGRTCDDCHHDHEKEEEIIEHD
jgi:hypothetical protein